MLSDITSTLAADGTSTGLNAASANAAGQIIANVVNTQNAIAGAQGTSATASQVSALNAQTNLLNAQAAQINAAAALAKTQATVPYRRDQPLDEAAQRPPFPGPA